jgi:hypothetical protein
MIRTGHVGAKSPKTLFRDRPVTFDGTSEQTSSIIVRPSTGNWLEEVHV